MKYLSENETKIPVKDVYNDFYLVDNSWQHSNICHILEAAYEKDQCAGEFRNGILDSEGAKQKVFLLLLAAVYIIRKPLCANGVLLGFC